MVSASFFINLKDGLFSIINLIVFPSTVYGSLSPFVFINFNSPVASSTLNVISFDFVYPFGGKISFNVYTASSSFPSMYWYNPVIVIFPFVSVVYSPSSCVSLYNLNFAPDKYLVSELVNVCSAFAFISSSDIAVSITLCTFDISKLYVGIFSFCIFITAFGKLSSSVISFSFTLPSFKFILYVPSVFSIINFIMSDE